MKFQLADKIKLDSWGLGQIELDLCSPREAVDTHIDFVLDSVLSRRPYRQHVFKFGITAEPSRRWTVFGDYNFLDLMVLVFTSENSDDTANLEKKSIKRYRSDNRLQNIKPGGENAHGGVAPHFVYIVFGTHWQFDRGRMLAR